MSGYKRKWPTGLRGPGFSAPPRWQGWSADVHDLGDGITAQEWAPIRKGCSWFVTSAGEYFTVSEGETPAEAYEQLQLAREQMRLRREQMERMEQQREELCACLSYTELAGPEVNDGTGQTHVTSHDYTQQESK